MSANRIRFENDRDTGFESFRFGRALAITLATVVVGAGLILALGNSVKAQSGADVQGSLRGTLQVAMAEPAATPAPPAAEPAQAKRRQVRVIPLFNIPEDQKIGERR